MRLTYPAIGRRGSHKRSESDGGSHMMDGLLRKKDVTEAVDLPKTTAHDWLHDFRVFIPTVQDGRTTYFKQGAIDVLLVVKELREKGYDKAQISVELTERGFAIDHDEMVNRVVKARDRAQEQAESAHNRDSLLTVTQMMGVAMERMTELEREIQAAKDREIEQHRINGENAKLIAEQALALEQQAAAIEKQNKYIEESLKVRDQKLTESLRRSQDETKKEIAEQAAASDKVRQKEIEEIRQQQSKGFFAKIFGK